MRKINLLPVILIIIFLITGCSSKNSAQTTTDNKKGRYMEANISLPDGIGSDATIQLTKINGMPGLYVFSKEEDKCVISRFHMNEDETWIEDTHEWLSNIKLSPDLIWLTKIFEDSNGNQYLYTLEQADDNIKGMLLRSTDGITYEKITPPEWEIVDKEYGFYRYPQLVNALSDGTLVALFYGGDIHFYNKETFNKENSITGNNYVATILSVKDQNLIVGLAKNNDYTLIGIDVYNASNLSNKESYPLSTLIASNSYLDVNEKGDIIICNSDGVHILEEGTSIWQTIIDGTLNSLSMQNKWIDSFIACSDLNYYTLFRTNQGYQLVKYYYDETVNAVPSTELTVYTLTENSTLRQAAAEFQESHPDVKVSIHVAMSVDEYRTASATTIEDYIKALNTELLAGKGSDILVLDDLPADSLIEKGILSDISDVIKPMLDNGELYEKIIQNYYHDGKIYSVPARFELPLILCREADAKNISTLESLAAYIKENPDNKLFGRSTYTDFLSTYSPFLSARILNNDGSINRENLITVLNLLKDISAAYDLMDSYPNDIYRADGLWELASKVKLATSSCAGFLDSMFPLGIVTYVNGTFAALDQTVTPTCVIGINSKSDKQDLCKEFITVALSKDIGSNDFYDGFSINKEALALCASVDRSNYMAVSDIENEDGSTSIITFGVLTEEQSQTLIDACNNAYRITYTDSQIVTAIEEEIKNLLTNSKSVEEIADQIIERTKLYLSE